MTVLLLALACSALHVERQQMQYWREGEDRAVGYSLGFVYLEQVVLDAELDLLGRDGSTATVQEALAAGGDIIELDCPSTSFSIAHQPMHSLIHEFERFATTPSLLVVGAMPAPYHGALGVFTNKSMTLVVSMAGQRGAAAFSHIAEDEISNCQVVWKPASRQTTFPFYFTTDEIKASVDSITDLHRLTQIEKRVLLDDQEEPSSFLQVEMDAYQQFIQIAMQKAGEIIADEVTDDAGAAAKAHGFTVFTESVNDKVVNDVYEAVRDPMKQSIVNLVTDDVGKQVTAHLTKSMTPVLGAYLTENVVSNLVIHIGSILAAASTDAVVDQLTTNVPMMLERMMVETGFVLNMTDIITPAVTSTLATVVAPFLGGVDPQAAAAHQKEVCEQCHSILQLCNLCASSTENIALTRHHALHASEYYTNHYGAYYDEALRRRFEVEFESKED